MEKTEYSDKDLHAKISRNKETKQIYFDIETEGKWKLYLVTDIDNKKYSKPLIEGSGSKHSLLLDVNIMYPIEFEDTIRYYFQLVMDNDKVILADHHLPMQGGYNFRDLGGIKNKDGKYVKWGKIFRSDDLHTLTEIDLKYLSSIPLTTLVDFRSREEIEKASDKIPSSVKNYCTYSINPGNLMAEIRLDGAKSLSELDNIMAEMNILFVTDSAAINEYKKFFDLLQNKENTPIMFHCSAGKDRTGMGAALILFALGVDEETIYNDYLQSNEYLGDKYAQYIVKYPHLEPLFKVKREYLKAGIDKIKKDHGTVENYLIKVLHVDIDKMREMYLY